MRKRSITILILIFSFFGYSQETIDATDPSTFIIGGDQGYHFLSMNLLEVHIIDVEPEFNNAISVSVDPNTLEAGEPALGGSGSAVNEDLWINITNRTTGADLYSAVVYTNQAVPSGFEIKVEVLNTTSVDGEGATGTAVSGELVLSETPTTVITDIGRGYTNDGVNKGYQLRYTISNTGGGDLPVGFEIVYELVAQ